MDRTTERKTGYPDNWEQLTPEQKREWRLNKFVSGEGVNFVSKEARKDYRIRAQRLVDAHNLKEPDRVPISLPVGDLPYNLYGINAHSSMYDYGKAVEACKQFNEKYSSELEYWANPMALPAKVLDILDYKLYAWPGHGLSVEAPGYQFLEGEYMKPEEYDSLIRDPSDFWLRTFMPRIYGAFESFRLLQPLTDMIEIPTGQLMTLGFAEIKETLRKLLAASDEFEKRAKAVEGVFGMGPANGFPASIRALCKAPFDTLGDTLRGTTAIMKDIYRRPEKVLEAADAMADVAINSMLNSPHISEMFLLMFPLHKGADGWMSQKQFETFYWPSLKKVMDAYIKEGLIITLFAEGSYNTRLEYVNVFPRGSVCWLFDQTDMVRAKRLLGDKCCLQGNVPSSLIVTGSPGDVKEYCRNLIEGCGQGGGYILSAGCVAENPKLENLRAMVAAVNEYGVYRK
jgi:hypothetical protein